MNKNNILLITLCVIIFPLVLCAMQMKERESEDTIQIKSSQNLQMGDSVSHRKKCWPYKVYSDSYKQWTCDERAVFSFPCIAATALCLASREYGTLLNSCGPNRSCSQVHQFVWCSKDMWFPCQGDSVGGGFCCFSVNGISVITIGSAAVALCIFAPWFKKCGGKKNQDEQLATDSIELEEE